ncbi:amidohydrolase family protein [Mesotoga sp. Brook.08.YT.4.2.5.1]|uniref:amidohydrolase family protein n=1 Tax=Mesotoga sp. Brook.08.YT.4.2.5.1 TaxID=1421001 RepID=UPI0021558DEA|nr:amidohydrolase family protein [Mesotoga sp. Brook.08.YT.4.2.5.1]
MNGYSLKGGFVYLEETGAYSCKDLYIDSGEFSADTPYGAQEIDISGKFVYPGFVDSHAHLIGTGRKSLEVDLEAAALSNRLPIG